MDHVGLSGLYFKLRIYSEHILIIQLTLDTRKCVHLENAQSPGILQS